MDDAAVGDSFEDYVSGRGRALLRFAFVLCRDHELSKDLVQDALIKTHARWHKVDSPDAYVRKAIVNDFLSWKRRGAARDVVTDRLPETAVDPGHAEDRDAMWRVLATLPRQQRAVLVLRFYEGLDDDSIGRTLGCTAATVRSHASKALATLRASDASTRYAEGSAR
jgi:RNA polymerase sigma-70 factor (sigma-E family)